MIKRDRYSHIWRSSNADKERDNKNKKIHEKFKKWSQKNEFNVFEILKKILIWEHEIFLSETEEINKIEIY